MPTDFAVSLGTASDTTGADTGFTVTINGATPITNINDANDSTYCEATIAGTGSLVKGGYIEYILTLSHPIHLTSFVAIYQYTQLYNDNLVYYITNGGVETFYLSGGVRDSTSVQTSTFTGDWPSFTKLRFVLYMGVNTAPGAPATISGQVRCYELKLFGESYPDSGIRVYGSSRGTEKLAMLPVSATSQIRFRKGSTTYELVVGNTTDSDASALRVRIGGVTKAFKATHT